VPAISHPSKYFSERALADIHTAPHRLRSFCSTYLNQGNKYLPQFAPSDLTRVLCD
jgi:hypothetical protein